MPSTSEFQAIAARSLTSEFPRIDAELTLQKVSAFQQDGSSFSLNTDGRVVHAEYASGAAVRRHNHYSIARSIEGSHWFINRFGSVFPLD